MPLIAYDGSVWAGVFFIRFLRGFVKFHKPWQVITRLMTFLSFLSFFKGDRQHIRKFVGIRDAKKYVSIKNVLDSAPGDKIFFKMDIEGGEYRILDTLFAYQHRLTGCAVEFHDCDLHMDRIRTFVESFSLPLVHIHANNVGQISPDHIPYVLEMTFTSHPKNDETVSGSSLDRDNDPKREPIHLSFAE